METTSMAADLPSIVFLPDQRLERIKRVTAATRLLLREIIQDLTEYPGYQGFCFGFDLVGYRRKERYFWPSFEKFSLLDFLEAEERRLRQRLIRLETRQQKLALKDF